MCGRGVVTALLHPRGTKPSSAWCKTSQFWFTSSCKRDFRWEGWLRHLNATFVCKVLAPSGYQQAAVGQLSHRLVHINELYSLAWVVLTTSLGFILLWRQTAWQKKGLAGALQSGKLQLQRWQKFWFSAWWMMSSSVSTPWMGWNMPLPPRPTAFHGIFSAICLRILHLPSLAHVDLHMCRHVFAYCFTTNDFPESWHSLRLRLRESIFLISFWRPPLLV